MRSGIKIMSEKTYLLKKSSNPSLFKKFEARDIKSTNGTAQIA
jgi:hypothetical protein